MKKDILITGKFGFIGREIEGGTTFTGDIRDLHQIYEQSKGMKGIVHLAGVAGWQDCKKNPTFCLDSNIKGTMNVLEVAKKLGLWVLFISTYQIKHQSLYGITKLAGEELCRIYKEKGVNVKILRLHLVYGPNDRPYKVVTSIIDQIKKGEEPTIVTDEKFYFNYVTDVVNRIEHEVDILDGGEGKPYTLHDLVSGIRKCLKL